MTAVLLKIFFHSEPKQVTPTIFSQSLKIKMDPSWIYWNEGQRRSSFFFLMNHWPVSLHFPLIVYAPSAVTLCPTSLFQSHWITSTFVSKTYKAELKELSKSENSIKYPCWCHLQWQRQLAQVSQTLNTASSGWFTFTNISGTKLINITLIQKFNIHRKYLQVQRDSQKKKKNLSKAQFLILKSFSPLRCFNKRSWKLHKSHFKFNLTIFL